ncbi:ABC transporter permease subunit [Frankia sp. AgKG'84/4]|uniref:ABC transporter permease subunit n=1 Tax=Frankia sp. AgKG'84/4 TaxID=573490 RepID=UPI00200E617C|nr:ABC transporter permease subunit [Frankia sp. AgKG'84/4]MCL9795353.1 ABC transporter permease subunit [Frankia sp. AgKG'84/4]
MSQQLSAGTAAALVPDTAHGPSARPASPGNRRFPAPTWTDTVAAEWLKLRAMRATRVIAWLGPILGVALCVLLAVAVGLESDTWSAQDRADFDPLLFSLISGLVSGVMIILLGVLAGAGEFRTGLIRVTLTVTPRRGRVLLAKVAVVAVVSWVGFTVVAVLATLAVQPVFHAYDLPGIAAAHLDAGEETRTLVTAIAVAPVLPLIGLSFAVLTRSTAGGVTSVLGLLFAPEIAGGLLPSWVADHILIYLPGAATDSVSRTGAEDAGHLSVAVAVLVVAAWLAFFLGAAHRTLQRRDA